MPKPPPLTVVKVVPVDHKGERIPAALLQLSDGSWRYNGLIPFTFNMKVAI